MSLLQWQQIYQNEVMYISICYFEISSFIISQNMHFQFSDFSDSESSSNSSTSPSRKLSYSTLAPTTSVQTEDDDDFVFVKTTRRKEREVEPEVQISSDLRVVEYDLVLATGVMRELNSYDILNRNCYFGRYGQVSKIIISSKHITFSALNQDIQTFVTYKNELDAAFAIAALRDLKHHNKHMIKIHYGTSRYCSSFIMGLECKTKGCFFNHRIRQNHDHKDLLKDKVLDQYERVYDLIEANLYYFVEKEYFEFKNRHRLDQQVSCKCSKWQQKVSFPSCKEVMQTLVAVGYIDKKEYDSIKYQIKLSNLAIKQRLQSLQSQNKQNTQESSNSSEKPKSDSSQTKQQLKASEKTQASKITSEIKCTETLEQYIEDHIINDSFGTKEFKLHPILLEHRLKRDCPFGVEKIGDLMNLPTCKSNRFNPEMDVSQYLINKIMNKAFRSSVQRCSRFDFAPFADPKTQVAEAQKFRKIISNKLINQ